MASTGGGFLLGFGLCLLLISSALFLFLSQQYEEVERWRSDVERWRSYVKRWRSYVENLYYSTHSSEYETAMNALETVGEYADKIADALNHPLIAWMGLGWLGDSLRQIKKAASKMRDVYYASEEVYQSMQLIEVAPHTLIVLTVMPHALTAAIFLAIIFIIAGIALIARARRK